MALVVKYPSANVGDEGSNSGSGRTPGGEHGNPLQYGESPWTEGPGGLQSMGSQESDRT